MKIGLLVSAGALVVAAMAVAAMPPQDARSRGGDDAAAAPGVDHAAMQAQMVELNKPGPEHADMKKMVGTWQVAVKTWQDPAASPDNSKGTSTIEMANDRQLLEHFSGEIPDMGGHYEGWGILAFNNATKEYEHVWRDSMNTGLMWSTGKRSADGTLTLTGKATCPMGPMTRRMVSKMNGNDAFHLEMYCTMEGMPEMKVMEMEYTRGSAAKR
jgi:hypothetical protein